MQHRKRLSVISGGERITRKHSALELAILRNLSQGGTGELTKTTGVDGSIISDKVTDLTKEGYLTSKRRLTEGIRSTPITTIIFSVPLSVVCGMLVKLGPGFLNAQKIACLADFNVRRGCGRKKYGVISSPPKREARGEQE